MREQIPEPVEQAQAESSAEEPLTTQEVFWWGVFPLLVLGGSLLALLLYFPAPRPWQHSLSVHTQLALLECLRALSLLMFSLHFGRSVYKTIRCAGSPLRNWWRAFVNLLWYGGVSIYLY
jgi:hypothetical protein